MLMPYFPPLARLELERSREGGVLAGRDVGHAVTFS